MKTLRIVAAAFFTAFVILAAIGIYMIMSELSEYTVLENLPEGLIRDFADYLFGFFQPAI